MSKRFHSTDAGHAIADALADDDRAEALGDRVLDRVAHAAGHRHAGDDHGVDAVRPQEAGEVRAVEGARELLHDHLLARLGRDALVDRDRVRAELQHLDRDLVVPDAHVACSGPR